MKHHRRIVWFFSVAVTCFVLGAIVFGIFVAGTYRKKLDDPKFLESQLNSVVKKTDTKPKNRHQSLVCVDTARKELINTIRPYYGHLVEVQLARISTEVSGLVVDLPIEVGQKVKGGETLIAQIDQTWLELTVAETEAEIHILEKQFAYQISELERFEKQAGHSISDSELNNQRTLVEQFGQNLEKARIANREAKEKLKRTTILAPFDGYVIRRTTGVGELLAPGTSIAEVVSLGTIDARVNVVEMDINHIKIGDEMPIIVDKLGIKVVGKVHSIVPYDITTTKSFPVIVRLDDHNGELKSGMSATALVAVTDPKEEIVVSKNAVLEKPDGSTVWVAVEETPEDADEPVLVAKAVPVQITADSVSTYGIIPETDEGKQWLVVGAKTIVEGAERLTHNQQIRITEIDPKLMENLPSVTGHRIIKQKERVGR
jgi:RND family efflux transporter MFP subunit